MVVDDNPRNIQVIANILREANYEVGFALDGKIALDQLHASPDFDLVLLDIRMPVLSGYEVYSVLQNEERFREIPVIFLSLSPEPEGITGTFKTGDVDWITKPINGTELLARVNTHLRLKRMNGELTEKAREIERLTACKEKLFALVSRDLKAYLESDKRLENLLTWASSQNGEIIYHPTLTALDELIRKTTFSYSKRASSKNIRLWYTSGPLPLNFRTDEGMFGYILGNLLDNAIKFTREGGKVDVNAEHTPDSIVISVTDTGIGIPEPDRSRLFRIDGRLVPRNGTAGETGCGLGLILCRELLDQMGGTIRGDFSLSKGTRFIITLPLN